MAPENPMDPANLVTSYEELPAAALSPDTEQDEDGHDSAQQKGRRRRKKQRLFMPCNLEMLGIGGGGGGGVGVGEGGGGVSVGDGLNVLTCRYDNGMSSVSRFRFFITISAPHHQSACLPSFSRASSMNLTEGKK